MSDSRNESSAVGIWMVLFICLKLAKVAGFAMWSWWWLLLPIIPLLTEFIKYLVR